MTTTHNVDRLFIYLLRYIKKDFLDSSLRFVDSVFSQISRVEFLI